MDSHDLSKRVASDETHTGDNSNFDGLSDNDDDEDNNNSDAAASLSDEAPRRQLLVSSASVPMFRKTENDPGDNGSKPPSEFGGSETDLSRGDEIDQTALQLSQLRRLRLLLLYLHNRILISNSWNSLVTKV